jgi:hypothetical protein
MYEVCLTAGKSSLTIALTLGASPHSRKVLVAARSTSLINLSAMRYQFGGHLEKSEGNSEAA